MPMVLETVPLGSPGAQWEYRIQAVQGLDRGFLIDAKHRRMFGIAAEVCPKAVRVAAVRRVSSGFMFDGFVLASCI